MHAQAKQEACGLWQCLPDPSKADSLSCVYVIKLLFTL